MYCQSGSSQNYGYLKKSNLTEIFVVSFGYDDVWRPFQCKKYLLLLTTAIYMQHNSKDNFLRYFVYLNNYLHTYAVFCLF